jgi:CPA2 family monovalent cation:H+ antiporter-2
MVLSRLLIDRGELLTQHGRVMISITLVEDLAVVILTVLLPVMADPEGSAWTALLVIGKALLVVVPITMAAARFAPRVLARVARTQSQELYLLVALALGLATAAVTQAIGLSLALGAFLAGMVISESEYAMHSWRCSL